jgi:hypothetical protein
VVAQDNANFFWDDTNNRLGIGTGASPSAPLHVVSPNSSTVAGIFKAGNSTPSADAFQVQASNGNVMMAVRWVSGLFGNKMGTYFDGPVAFGGTAIDPNAIMITATNRTDPTTTQYGAYFAIGSVLTANNANALTGGNFQVSTNSGAFNTTGTYQGGSFQVLHQTAGTMAIGIGASGTVYNVSGGTLTEGIAVNSTILNNSATITNAYGVKVAVSVNGGTITNTYGIYIDDITTGTQTNQAYGLYQADTGARNYFAGPVGVGVTAPGAKVHVLAPDSSTRAILAKAASNTATQPILELQSVSGAVLTAGYYTGATSGQIGLFVSGNSSFGNSATALDHRIGSQISCEFSDPVDAVTWGMLTVNRIATTANSSTVVYGGQFTAYHSSGGNNVNNIIGGGFQALDYTAGSVFNLIGGTFASELVTTGTATNQIGGDFNTVVPAGGTASETYGIRVRMSNSGSISSSYYGVHVGNFNNSGTVANTYALYIADITAGTQTNQAYGIYQEDTGARNYFGGNVGFGDTTPSQAFICVGAGTTAKAQLNLASSTAPSSPADGDVWYDGTYVQWRTASLAMDGQAARLVAVNRHTTANTAGNSLTVNAGGATSGATDKNGGNLVLASGTATGTGLSSVVIQAATAGSTGTTDRSPATVATFGGAASHLSIVAGTTAKAQMNLASSTAPSSPADGDVWFDGTDVKIRVSGATKTFTLT